MITELSRDWGRNPAIVRMVADDDLQTVLGSTYIADEQDNINEINFGGFTWLDSDLVLAELSDGKVFLDVNVASDGTVTLTTASTNRSMVTYVKVADDALAADTTDETPFFSPINDAVILSVKYIPNAALTANNTDYATLTVANRDAAGVAVGDIAAITTEITGTGDWVAFVAEDFGVLANTEVEAGGSVTFEIEKAGSGVVVPAGTLQVEYAMI